MDDIKKRHGAFNFMAEASLCKVGKACTYPKQEHEYGNYTRTQIEGMLAVKFREDYVEELITLTPQQEAEMKRREAEVKKMLGKYKFNKPEKLDPSIAGVLEECLDKVIEKEFKDQNYLWFPKTTNTFVNMSSFSNKIAMIKAYREITGEGLRESKDFIDKFWDCLPDQIYIQEGKVILNHLNM